MTRSDRDIYSDHVAVLARQLGFELDHLAPRDAERLLGTARQRRLNEHEAALLVGYGRVQALLDEDLERARVLAQRLGLVGGQWAHDGLVGRHTLTEMERDARDALQRLDD